MKRLLTTLLASAAFVHGAFAYSVSFDLEAHLLRSDATTPMPTTGLVLLVASTTNATFGTNITAGTSLATGSFLDGASGDDQILARFDLSLFSTPGVLLVNPSASTDTFTNLSSGDRLALYWFPTLTLSSTAVPNTQTSYGTYQTGNTLPLDGSAAWTMPAGTTNNYKLYFLTTDANTSYTAAGTHTVAESSATLLTVVPEPSTLALGALGIVGLGYVLRRRGARA